MIIKEKPQNSLNIIENILSSYLNEEDIEFHLDPNDDYNIEMKLLSDTLFPKSIDFLMESISENKKIGIYIDDDMDGFSSATILYRFIRDDLKYNNVGYILTEGKTHGLTDLVMKDIYKNGYDLVIMADAGTNNIKQQEQLNNDNTRLVILDHHEINLDAKEQLNTLENVIIINNQDDNILNKNYTGVGLAYIYVKYACYFLGLDYTNPNKYLDLVALGQTGDVSDISDKEIRNYIIKGLDNLNNKFLIEILKNKGIDNPASRDLSFSAISMINAVTRIGSVDDKKILFDALINESDELIEMEIRKKNKKTGKFDKVIEDMTVEQVAVRHMTSLKTKQDTLVKNSLKKINVLYDDEILFAVLDDIGISSINGLIAMKLMDKHKKPVMIARKGKDKYSGSMRSPDQLFFKDYLSRSNLFNFVEGHMSAAGFSLDIDMYGKFIDYVKKNKVKENDIEYYVDRKYTRLDAEDIYDIVNNMSIFGGRIKYPKLGYENIKINKKSIKLKGSMVTFFDNGVDLVLYSAPNYIIDKILNNNENFLTLNVIGEPTLSSWGNLNPQIVIKDIEIKDEDQIKEIENIFGIDF